MMMMLCSVSPPLSHTEKRSSSHTGVKGARVYVDNNRLGGKASKLHRGETGKVMMMMMDVCYVLYEVNAACLMVVSK